ncbi:hypothetical protein BJV77DRAFT_1025606 [Russula vinacea]|jgi:hypothetical protein|nr:hypothetical protein BJV77DRAFT_1025606 [Russula vinacea]
MTAPRTSTGHPRHNLEEHGPLLWRFFEVRSSVKPMLTWLIMEELHTGDTFCHRDDFLVINPRKPRELE